MPERIPIRCGFGRARGMGNFATRQTNQVLHSICKSSMTAIPRTQVARSKLYLGETQGNDTLQKLDIYSRLLPYNFSRRNNQRRWIERAEPTRGRGRGPAAQNEFAFLLQILRRCGARRLSDARLNRLLRSRFVRSLLISSDDESSFREEISDGGMKRERAQTTDADGRTYDVAAAQEHSASPIDSRIERETPINSGGFLATPMS